MHPIPSRRRWVGLACAALCAAPLAWAGPKIGMGDWFYLAARKR